MRVLALYAGVAEGVVGGWFRSLYITYGTIFYYAMTFSSGQFERYKNRHYYQVCTHHSHTQLAKARHNEDVSILDLV